MVRSGPMHLSSATSGSSPGGAPVTAELDLDLARGSPLG
ncbi:MAG: hypothetical protein AVDCRST_MAG87-230 [uncultured Thermomicrobiales bacterium]|uniref:Uncharacterized protein n=1 Tax=uncultured Thermomicrobiales bacterium TaxID=1645740 RepID=A0A6J4UAB8_9BACT|nr:MAG: hypothetical protein AVDCRST_MAG87-230 [uncultured Thermomicrobiales bacterium]